MQTVNAKIEGSAVLGQGESRPMINGEWRDEGKFEIGDARPRFAGFVAEDVNDLPLPQGAYTGALTIGKPQVSGSSVAIEMQARWSTRPDSPEQRAASRLSIDFPAELRPDYEQVGSLDARLEVLEKSEHSFPLFFTAGIHNLVTTNAVPPDRHLVEGNAIPPLWKPLEHNMGADCRGGSWVWTQGAGNPTYQAEPTEGLCSVRLELGGAYREARFGNPERGLASHLHDSTTLWVIPVFYSLADDQHPWSSGQKVNVRSYGYALYAAQPYTGPGPAGRPAGGERTRAGASEAVAGTPAGTPARTRTGGETGATTGDRYRNRDNHRRDCRGWKWHDRRRAPGKP